MNEELETRGKINALVALAANYGKTFDEDLLDMWLGLLEGYSAGNVRRAVMELIQTDSFKTIPPFAVLKKALDRTAGAIDREKALEMKAEAEWGKLLEALSSSGIYKGPPEDMHPTTAYALRQLGGWDAACQWEVKYRPFRKKEFLEIWKLSDGHVDSMMLGAGGVAAIERADATLDRLVGNMKLALDSGEGDCI